MLVFEFCCVLCADKREGLWVGDSAVLFLLDRDFLYER